jgi:hypothetical protein
VAIQKSYPHEPEEEPPDRQRRRGKPGVLVWVWLVCGGVGALLFMGCACAGGVTLLWYQSRTNPRVTDENYNKLHLDMTEAEVKAVMGEPNATAEAYFDCGRYSH